MRADLGRILYQCKYLLDEIPEKMCWGPSQLCPEILLKTHSVKSAGLLMIKCRMKQLRHFLTKSNVFMNMKEAFLGSSSDSFEQHHDMYYEFEPLVATGYCLTFSRIANQELSTSGVEWCSAWPFLLHMAVARCHVSSNIISLIPSW